MPDLAIANAFSRYPAGRTDKDGHNNGTRFREEVLVPSLRQASSANRLRVILDGARSYGSSFLDEAFGGLIRYDGYTVAELSELMEIVAIAPVYMTYKRLIGKYLTEATSERKIRQRA